MEIDKETSKLLVFFLLVNLVSAGIGLIAVHFLGVIPGLAVFSILIIALPLALQYLYLSKEVNEE